MRRQKRDMNSRAFDKGYQAGISGRSSDICPRGTGCSEVRRQTRDAQRNSQQRDHEPRAERHAGNGEQRHDNEG